VKSLGSSAVPDRDIVPENRIRGGSAGAEDFEHDDHGSCHEGDEIKERPIEGAWRRARLWRLRGVAVQCAVGRRFQVPPAIFDHDLF